FQAGGLRFGFRVPIDVVPAITGPDAVQDSPRSVAVAAPGGGLHGDRIHHRSLCTHLRPRPPRLESTFPGRSAGTRPPRRGGPRPIGCPIVPTERRSAETLGGALIALAALQFGTVVVLGKVVQRHLSVPSMLALRFGIAALVLVAALVVRRETVLPAPGERLPLAALGMLGYAFESAMFFLGLRHGQAAAVTLLFFTYPVIVALASWALGRGAPGWLLGGSLMCAVSGAALVVLASGGLAIRPLG